MRTRELPQGRSHRVIVHHGQTEGEDEVEEVTDSQGSEVVVGRRLHPGPRQHGDVDGVAGAAEQHNDGHDHLI